MKRNKLISAMVLSMSLSLISCGDKDTDVSQKSEAMTATQSSSSSINTMSGIMEYIPADTPILATYVQDPKHPIPENLKKKAEKMYESIGDVMKMAMQENMKKYAEKSGQNGANKGSEFIDKWLSEDGLKKIGLSLDEMEFALYAVDYFPVLRMTLADSHSIEELFDELMGQANETDANAVVKKDVNGHTTYLFGDKEVKVMVSVKGNSIVGSFAPAREVEQLMPQLLGFNKPSKNIAQSNHYHDTVNKYNYLSNMLYWINFRELADVFVNPDQYQTPLMDLLEVRDNIFSADCKTEILQIVDKFPRMVGGYTLMQEHAINSHMAIELADGLGSKLSTMTGRIPSSTATDAAISYGFSFDIEAAKKLALEFVTQIEMAPYKCEYMANLNMQAQTFKSKLEQPLPPFVGNFKGANVIVNEMDLDLTQKDPSEMVKNLKAKVLLAVDNPEALKGMAEMMMPEIQKLGLKTGEKAVNVSNLIPISGSQIPVNLDHVFLAMGGDTLGASLGEGTDVELTKDVSAESLNELFNITISAEIYKTLFSGLSGLSKNLGDEVQQQIDIQKNMMTEMLWWESETASMNFTDRGFEVKMNIVY